MKHKIIIAFLLFLIISGESCRKNFEEINTPNDLFTNASDGSLFNGILASCMRKGNELFYLNNEVLYKQSQLAALTKEAWGNYPIGTEEVWSNYYTIMPNIRELEKRFDEHGSTPEVNNMKAMLKIIKAYKTFKVTDFFGDIPYTEAGYGYQDANKLYPKFDKQRDIYLSLLDDLKWADENINLSATGEPFASFSAFDKLFDGDLLMWKKFANSLRLRYAMRMADKEPALAGAVVGEIINGNKEVLVGASFGSAPIEKAALYYYKLGTSSDAIYWSFREHRNLRMGSMLWHQMSDNDSTNGSGIFDARAYLFFDTNNENKWVAYPQNPPSGFPPDGGSPYGQQRESDGGYSIKGDLCLYSPFNFYMISDGYHIPEILMTGQEVNFLKAEAYLRGIGVPQSSTDADNEFLSGLQASYTFWRNTMSIAALPHGVLPFDSVVKIPAVVNLSLLQSKTDLFNFSTNEEKLKMIYSQRMIDLFWQPCEAFALARTGRTPREGNPISFYRFPIPNSEVNYNSQHWSEAYGASDLTSTKLWWIP